MKDPKDFNRWVILIGCLGIILTLLFSRCSTQKELPAIWQIKNMKIVSIDSSKTFLEKMGLEKQTMWIYTGVILPTERTWLRTYADIDTSIHKGDTVRVRFDGWNVKLRK